MKLLGLMFALALPVAVCAQAAAASSIPTSSSTLQQQARRLSQQAPATAAPGSAADDILQQLADITANTSNTATENTTTLPGASNTTDTPSSQGTNTTNMTDITSNATLPAVEAPLDRGPRVSNTTEAATQSIEAQQAAGGGTLLAPIGVLHDDTSTLSGQNGTASNAELNATGPGTSTSASPAPDVGFSLPSEGLPGNMSASNTNRTPGMNTVPLADCLPGEVAVGSQCVSTTQEGRSGADRSVLNGSVVSSLPGAAGRPASNAASASLRSVGVHSSGQWLVSLLLIAFVAAAAPVHVAF